jgi:predicted nucleic acid-binding protein
VIILDTDVISEVMRGPKADTGVVRWVRGLRETPVTTVLNRAEILAGLAVLPQGIRRDQLWTSAQAAFDQLGVCLPLVPECATAYAEIVAERRSSGRPIGGMDALIASIARVTGSTLATRDIEGFSGLGLDLVDPWIAA